MTTKTPKKGNYQQLREQLFEVEIKPLIDNLAAKCNEYNFPIYAGILIIDEDDKTIVNTTVLQAHEMPNSLQVCALMTREPVFAKSVADLVTTAIHVNEKLDELKAKILAKGGSHEPES